MISVMDLVLSKIRGNTRLSGLLIVFIYFPFDTSASFPCVLQACHLLYLGQKETSEVCLSASELIFLFLALWIRPREGFQPVSHTLLMYFTHTSILLERSTHHSKLLRSQTIFTIAYFRRRTGRNFHSGKRIQGIAFQDSGSRIWA